MIAQTGKILLLAISTSLAAPIARLGNKKTKKELDKRQLITSEMICRLE